MITIMATMIMVTIMILIHMATLMDITTILMDMLDIQLMEMLMATQDTPHMETHTDMVTVAVEVEAVKDSLRPVHLKVGNQPNMNLSMMLLMAA